MVENIVISMKSWKPLIFYDVSPQSQCAIIVLIKKHNRKKSEKKQHHHLITNCIEIIWSIICSYTNVHISCINVCARGSERILFKNMLQLFIGLYIKISYL